MEPAIADPASNGYMTANVDISLEVTAIAKLSGQYWAH
jgi:hypothetical protein